ncbi:hypothetical protein JCM16106_06280 [Hydrogenophilus islandicus]
MSYGISRIPTSAQQGVHTQLVAVVRRHLATPFRKPYAPYNLAAFERFRERWDGRTPVILDSGCGVGWSSLRLARDHPEALVVGVDQSEERLNRRKPLPEALWPENLLFLRADVIDFWRLLAEARVPLLAHWWLYPNPWPKIGHLKRRWYAHPVWPTVLELGGQFECRTNWPVFAEELAVALHESGVAATVTPFVPQGEPLTPFERKYHDSHQSLYRVTANLSERRSTP